VPQRPNYDAETLIPRARTLRADATPAERELWDLLRGGKLGLRFRRQQPVGPFIVDFYCAAAGLVVELDGAGHAERQAYDDARTAWLNGRGLTVLRFANAEVLERPHIVHAEIMKALLTLTPALRATPLPQGERGTKERI
jgi:very-short-patch-repair endonuclease